MDSPATVLSMSREENGSSDGDEYDVFIHKYFGNCALTAAGKVILFHPFTQLPLEVIVTKICAFNEKLILYISSNDDLYCSWLYQERIISTRLLKAQVLNAALGEGYNPHLLVLNKNGKMERTFLKLGNLEWHPINTTLPTDVCEMVTITMGTLAFVMTRNPKHQSMIYFLDPHLRLKLVYTIENSLAIARYRGKLYFLKKNGSIFGWGGEGLVLCYGDLLIKEKFETTIMSERDSNECTSTGLYRYFTLEEIVKFQERERERYCHLEMA